MQTIVRFFVDIVERVFYNKGKANIHSFGGIKMTFKSIWDRYYIAIIFIITCFVLGIVLLIVTVNQADTEYNEVSIASGDSIWSLADDYAGKYKMSKQDFVAWVEKENQLIDGKLTAGDKIVIPVKQTNLEQDNSIQLANE